jgi:Myb-like DNA-binding domain.
MNPSYLLNTSLPSLTPSFTLLQANPCLMNAQFHSRIGFNQQIPNCQCPPLCYVNPLSAMIGLTNPSILLMNQLRMLNSTHIVQAKDSQAPPLINTFPCSQTKQEPLELPVSKKTNHVPLSSSVSPTGESSKLKPKDNSNSEIWTEERVQLLMTWVKACRCDWKKIARRFKNKKITPFQVKTKYKTLTQENYTQLRVKFSIKEDLILAKYYRMYGSKWDKICEHFRKRDPIMIKNRYYSHLRKKNLLHSLLRIVDQLELTHNSQIEDIDIDDSLELLSSMGSGSEFSS